MQITSAFFADHVAIYENKLNVLGAVWSFYTLGDLPSQRTLPVAVIAQVGPDDRGSMHNVELVMRSPDGSVVGKGSVQVTLASDFDSEYLCLAFGIDVAFIAPGRHVAQFSVAAEPQMALPLDVRIG